MRQVVLDTETTGMETSKDHRIIEIGCVELENRRHTGRHFHCYLNPEREVDEGAYNVHGMDWESLLDKPLFAEIVDEFVEFISGAELVIHNAAFDVGFLDHEFKRHNKKHKAKLPPIAKICTVTDSLAVARNKHPGQKNNLDALCKRYGVDNSKRELHGALLDAEILADVYLLMTGGQTGLFQASSGSSANKEAFQRRAVDTGGWQPPVIAATSEELEAHSRYVELMNKKSGGASIFKP